MSLLDVIKRKDPATLRRILGAAVVSGFASVVSLSQLNDGAAQHGTASMLSFFLFLLATVIWLVQVTVSVRQSIQLVEGITHDTRLRLTDKIRRAEIVGLEHIGTTEIVDRVSENLGTIASAAEKMAWLPQFVGMLAFTMIYIVTISPLAFCISGATLGIGVALLFARSRLYAPHLARTATLRVRFLDAIGDLLKGFKEITLRDRRRKELGQDIEDLAESLQENSLKVHVLLNDDALFTLSLRYVLLGVAALVLPLYLDLDTNQVQNLISGIVALWAHVFFIVNLYPAMIRSNAAYDSIVALERKLDQAALIMPRGDAEEDRWGGRFATIEARGIAFQYSEASSERFHVGPLSVSFASNEVVFLVGNNGSGKSTLLKLLVGLFSPRQGSIVVDGVPVEPKNIQAYRELIAAVFSDFHLFAKLYGLSQIRDEVVADLIKSLKLDHAVGFSGGRFSTLDLSTGQRKRIALLVALLEDRPIMAFDEWAADQDPEYRRHFYEEILPELRGRGKLILVVTHDDRYFHLADRILTLEDGQLRTTRSPN